MPKKPPQAIEVCCKACGHPHGVFQPKELPKSFVCLACNLGQKYEPSQATGYSHKRNYPEGFWY